MDMSTLNGGIIVTESSDNVQCRPIRIQNRNEFQVQNDERTLPHTTSQITNKIIN
jgi:hypothetical protein